MSSSCMMDDSLKNKKNRLIFVAVDGSDASFHAVEWMVEHLYNNNGDDYVVCIHAFGHPTISMASTVPTISMSTVGGISPQDLDSIIKKSEDTANALLEHYLSFARIHSVDAEGCCVLGEVTQVLVELCSIQKPDVLVVGSRGSSKLKRLLLGSVSEYLRTHLHIPVIIVKKPHSYIPDCTFGFRRCTTARRRSWYQRLRDY